MVVNFVDLRPEHIPMFPLKNHYDGFAEDMLFNLSHPYRKVQLMTYGCYPLAIMGLNFTHSEAGDVWLIPSIYVDTFKYIFFKSVYNHINLLLFSILKLRRVQFYVLDTWDKGHKWAKTLGFEFEGIARSYARDGEDYACYAKIRRF